MEENQLGKEQDNYIEQMLMLLEANYSDLLFIFISNY